MPKNLYLINADNAKLVCVINPHSDGDRVMVSIASLYPTGTSVSGDIRMTTNHDEIEAGMKDTAPLEHGVVFAVVLASVLMGLQGVHSNVLKDLNI